MRKSLLAIFAALALQGCAGSRPGWQVYDAAQQEQIDEHEDRLRALEGNPCRLHSQAAHENASKKGYTLECEPDSVLYQDSWPDIN